MALLTIRRSVTYLALASLALVALLTTSTAQAQVDLANIEAVGTEKVKITIQGGLTLEYEGPITLDMDEDDNGVLSGTVEVVWGVDDDEKKIYSYLFNYGGLETQIEQLLEADPRFRGFARVETDLPNLPEPIKTIAKLKRDLDLKIAMKLPFILEQGGDEYRGKLDLKATLTEARPPACAGNSYDGVESLKVSAKGVGSAKSKDEVASLDLDADTTPFDRMLGFTYTNPSATPNTALTGSIDYTGKKPVIVLDTGSIADLEENLEAIILDVAQVATTVTLGTTKTSFKCGKNGDTAQWSYSAALTIDDGQEILAGKVAIKSKMGLD